MHTLRTSLLLCMLIYINYAGSEALSLLNQMQPKFKEESDLESEDLIYKKATEQLKQQQHYLQIDEEDTKNEVSFREFYKSVRSGKHEIVQDEEEFNIVEPEHKEIEIQSYLQELSDGLEPQIESITETALQTDPEKLGKFKKYFVKEEEPKVEVTIETKIENNQPVEKKLTLREKLEMKKKQAQQSSVVAAIQIKQEVNNQEQVTNQSDQNVAKTTLMKKIEEFKKQKQSKETQETQQPKEEIIQEQNIKPVPENPLRKLLNKKAQEKKEKEILQQAEQPVEQSVEEREDTLLGLTQETEIEIENKQEDVKDSLNEQDIINENISIESDDDSLQSQGEPNLQEIEQEQEQDESHQEYIISDENITNNEGSIQQQQQQQQIESKPEIESKPQVDNESQSFELESPDSIVQEKEQQQQQEQEQEQEQNQQEIENDEQINPLDENLEQEQNNNNDQDQIPQITKFVDDEQNDDQMNQEILQDNQEIMQDNQEQQSQVQQPYNEQQELDNEPQNEQQYLQDNKDKKQIIDQQAQDTNNETENEEIYTDDQMENTLSQGFVMENNVETSNYLEEVQEAEKLRKKKEVEDMIQEEERIKQELEQKKIEDEKKLNQLEEEEKQLIDEKQKEEQQIDEVQKQIDLEQNELQDFESKKEEQQQVQEKDLKKDDIQEVQPLQEVVQEDLNVQTSDISQQSVEEQPAIQQEKIEPKEIKSEDQTIKSQDETLENGFNIDEYERQQHRDEDKTQQEATDYSQSSELFHKNDYTSQILNDQQEQVIEQSIPTLQINEQQTEDIQYEPQIQISQEVKIDDNSDDQFLTNQQQDGSNDQYQITEQANPETQTIEEQDITQNKLVEETEVKEQEQQLQIDTQVKQVNEENEISNKSSQDSIQEELKIDPSNENENIESSQNYVYPQQETSIIESDTPNLIPVDESQSTIYQYDQEADNEDNDVVQFDVYNSSIDVDTQNNEQQSIDQINIQSQPIVEEATQQEVEDNSNVLSVNKVRQLSLLQQDMKIDDTIKIEYIDLEIKQDQSISQNTLIHQKRQQSSFLQVEETEMDYNQEQFEIFMEKKKQQEQMEKDKKRKKLKAREEKQRKLEEEQFQQKLLQQKQQQEILKQQQQLIELQNQQLLNKQKYKMATKQNNQVIIESKPIKGDNFSHLQKQQSQIQLINQQIDTEFSFQQIISKVEKEQRQGQKQLRSNSKHVKNADLNFFQLTEKQQQNKISLQSQDLFEAIKQEIKECDLNYYTMNLCQLCQSDVVYEINDDNWYLIGIAYGLKRHFQNLLNTVQYHFKNAKIYTSFNKEQQVCLTFGDQFEIENLEEILSYYNNQTLPRNSQFLRIPQKIKANFAQMKVDLNQHKFMNFSLNAAMKNQELHNGFTVTEQQIRLSEDFDYIQQGSILYPGQSIPYKMNVQSNGIENMQLDLNPQIYEKILENYLAKNYLQQIQVTYRDNLKSNFVVIDNDEVLELEITIQK